MAKKKDAVKVTCPHCQAKLTVDPALEAVIAHDPPPVKLTTEDLGAAFKNLQGASAPREGALLKRVSRSFCLSLAILPRSVRGPVGLAYLFARAADTIADTRLISREERLRHLEAFRDELWEEMPSRLAKILTACTGPNPHAGERELLSRLPECFARFRKLDKPDRDPVWRLLFTITE